MLLDEEKVQTYLLETTEIRQWLSVARRPDSHKGDFGHLLVLAGSVGKTGAAAMACEAALRMGAGLVTLGTQQRWWLQDVLAGMDSTALFFGSAALTAIFDNAALTYLGSLVQGVDEAFKYALVAGPPSPE